MENALVWWYNDGSTIITYIQQVIAELDYEPFYAKTKENWIDSRSSIEYDGNGEIYSMLSVLHSIWKLNAQQTLLRKNGSII